MFKTILDTLRGLKDMNDATVRDRVSIELQKEVLAAQAAQATLVERNSELEMELARFQTWEAEKQRYQLKDFGGDTFAYELKESEASGEPIHRICPACYQKAEASILQAYGRNSKKQDVYHCPTCKNEFSFGARQDRPLTVQRSPKSWT